MRYPSLRHVMCLHGLDPGPVVGPHDVDEGDGAASQHEQEEAEEGGEELHVIVRGEWMYPCIRNIESLLASTSCTHLSYSAQSQLNPPLVATLLSPLTAPM